jgi:hypothetical protein
MAGVSPAVRGRRSIALAIEFESRGDLPARLDDAFHADPLRGLERTGIT